MTYRYEIAFHDQDQDLDRLVLTEDDVDVQVAAPAVLAVAAEKELIAVRGGVAVSHGPAHAHDLCQDLARFLGLQGGHESFQECAKYSRNCTYITVSTVD